MCNQCLQQWICHCPSIKDRIVGPLREAFMAARYTVWVKIPDKSFGCLPTLYFLTFNALASDAIQRCGKNWEDAAVRCGSDCMLEEDCTVAGEDCFSVIGPCPSSLTGLCSSALCMVCKRPSNIFECVDDSLYLRFASQQCFQNCCLRWIILFVQILRCWCHNLGQIRKHDVMHV